MSDKSFVPKKFNLPPVPMNRVVPIMSTLPSVSSSVEVKEIVKHDIKKYFDVLKKLGIVKDENDLVHLELLRCNIDNMILVHYVKPSSKSPYPVFPYVRGVFIDIVKGQGYSSAYPWTPTVQILDKIKVLGEENDLQYFEIDPLFKNQNNFKFILAPNRESFLLKDGKSITIYKSNYVEKYMAQENEELVEKSIDVESKTTLRSYICGTVIRIMYYEGKVIFSTHRNADARTGRWGSDVTFLQMYQEAGGFPLEKMFDETKLYSPYLYSFMVMHPSNCLDLPIYIKSSHLFTLETIIMFEKEECPYDLEQVDWKIYKSENSLKTVTIKNIPFDLEAFNPVGNKSTIMLASLTIDEVNKVLVPNQQQTLIDTSFQDGKAPYYENHNLLVPSFPVIALYSTDSQLQEDVQRGLEKITIYSKIVKLMHPSVLRRIYLRAQQSDPFDSLMFNFGNPSLLYLTTYAGDKLFTALPMLMHELDKANAGTPVDPTNLDYPLIVALKKFNDIYLTPVENLNAKKFRKQLAEHKHILPFNVYKYGILEELHKLENKNFTPAVMREERTILMQNVIFINLLQSLPAGLQEENIDLMFRFYQSIDKVVNWLINHYQTNGAAIQARQFLRPHDSKDGVIKASQLEKTILIARAANDILDSSIQNATIGSAKQKDQKETFLRYLKANIHLKLLINPNKNRGLIRRINE